MRLRRLLSEEDGTITAEFAITIPAVLLVLAIVLGGVALAAERVALVAVAGDIARLEARGDFALAASRLASETNAPTLTRTQEGNILCVVATKASKPGLLRGITVTGRGCAARTIHTE